MASESVREALSKVELSQEESELVGELHKLQQEQNKAQKQAAAQQKVPPLPFLLSSLITSRKPRKLEEYDDDEYDTADDIVLGAPSPYDIPKVREGKAAETQVDPIFPS